MGWWKINCSGGISSDKPTGAGEESLLNAIPGRDTVEDHYGGDVPADIMGVAIAKIIAEYQDTWGRPPYIEELDGVWSFCTGTIRADGNVEKPPKGTEE